MSAEEYLDNYICENIGPFEDKFSKEDIEEILDDGNIEYNKDELDDLLQFALDTQEEIDNEGRRDLKSELYSNIDSTICDYDFDNLNNEDIASVLVQLANSYLNGD